MNGQNYLIPIDASIETQARVKYEAFHISDISEAFANNRQKVNIMILDACRDDPFRSWMRPLILILPKAMDSIYGVWIAFPIADFLAATITFIYLRLGMRQLNTQQEKAVAEAQLEAEAVV